MKMAVFAGLETVSGSKPGADLQFVLKHAMLASEYGHVRISLGDRRLM